MFRRILVAYDGSGARFAQGSSWRSVLDAELYIISVME